MKKILIILFAFLSFSVTRASAQLGFDFGMNSDADIKEQHLHRSARADD